VGSAVGRGLEIASGYQDKFSRTNLAVSTGLGMPGGGGYATAKVFSGMLRKSTIEVGELSTGKMLEEGLDLEEEGAAKGVPKYLYHYTSREAAQSISQSGLRVGRDGFSYLTNTKSLSPLQAQIELALPANRALLNSLLRINTSGLSPAAIRRVQGNLPGLGAGGGTEFLFNQHIPASAIKIIR